MPFVQVLSRPMSHYTRAAPRNGDPYEIYVTALDYGEHDVARGRFSRRGSCTR